MFKGGKWAYHIINNHCINQGVRRDRLPRGKKRRGGKEGSKKGEMKEVKEEGGKETKTSS